MCTILMFLLQLVLSAASETATVGAAVSWPIFAKEIRTGLRDCIIKINGHEGLRTPNCFKTATLDMFDKMVSSNVIPLTGRVSLMRTPNNNEQPPPVGVFFSHNESMTLLANERKETWSAHILHRIYKTFYSHIIQLDLSDILEDEPRHRHRRYQMLPVMVFGVTALGMVLIPIGFQFLAVIGGKALLLAKMALLLASLNGLKRVGISGVHYGLYQVPEYYNYGYYDRGDHITHPRVLDKKHSFNRKLFRRNQ